MDTRSTFARGRRGSSLVTVTILLGTMTVLALVFLRVGQNMTQEEGASLDATRANLLAEAGISEAIEALRASRSGNVGSADDPAYLGGGVLWVEATDLGSGRTQLDAIAMKQSGRAALRVVVEDAAGGGPGGSGSTDGFVGMLFANKGIELDQNVTIDSYDSTVGTYASQAVNTYGGVTYANAAGSASSNASIELKADVKVFGDVHTGPGYTPTLTGGAYVSGSTTPMSKTITLEQIPVPNIPASGAFSVANSGSRTINPGSYHYTSLTQGRFSTLKIVGPATLVIDGYTTGQSATLEVDCTNGPVTIYDTGSWVVDKNYTVRPVPGTPVDCAFLISSAGEVRFKQGGNIFVGFYAPNAKIKVDAGAEVWGALVADEIDVDQGTRFHFDENLRNFELPWEVPGESAGAPDPQVISWSKIEFPVRAFAADRRDPFALLQVGRNDLRTPSVASEDPEEAPKE